MNPKNLTFLQPERMKKRKAVGGLHRHRRDIKRRKRKDEIGQILMTMMNMMNQKKVLSQKGEYANTRQVTFT